MSRISEISRQYHAALADSQSQYEKMYKERVEATEKFYNDFFKQLVCNFQDKFNNERFRARLQEIVKRNTGADILNFVAIDGTCKKELFSDMITFFGGAYGARGEIALEGGKHQISYKRWSLDQDVSMVAWIPVPFARLDEVSPDKNEEFLMTEEDKINFSSVHTLIMQLAEIFLAYNTIQSSRLDAPNILLMDISPSSILASVAHSQSHIGLVGYPYDRRSLTKADITIALAHPFSDHLGIPSVTKKMDRARIIIAELHRSPTQAFNVKQLSAKFGIPHDELQKTAEYLEKQEVLEQQNTKGVYKAKYRVDESWSYTLDFFQNVCTRLFIKKDQGALQYNATDDDGILRRRWMAPNDIEFLIAVGMRLLIEACWERNVLFYGVVKDSSSKYLTRNYLGVCLETQFYSELENLTIGTLPWTDRIFCETLPLIDEKLEAPWSTIEFDSAFMTLHREKDPVSNQTKIAGIMGYIVNQEKLFVRSLGQFFLKRHKQTPLMGHVVFLERLLNPKWDLFNSVIPETIKVSNSDIGEIEVLTWKENTHQNISQIVMMYLLSVLAKNHYAEAIGYPDPLHKADQGAKTIGKSVSNIIKSSTSYLLSRPLSKTFRDIRDSKRR